jgi:hypothetical protein
MKLAIPIAQAPLSPLYLHALYFLLIFITACSVFKERGFMQADSLQKQTTRREAKTNESMQVDAVRIYNKEDSSDKQSFIEIFPQGLFNYSTEKGFSGNGKRVVINERAKAVMKMRDSAQIKQNKSAASNLRENERLLTQTRLTEKVANTNNLNFLYPIGLMLIFAVVYYFRDRLQE